MTKTFGRWVLGLTLAVGGVGVSVPMLVHADEPAPQQLATVDQLKAEAFKALKAGQFDRTSELLTKASAGANDPQLTKMAEWTKAFEDQRQTFVAERHKQFEKAVGDVKVLLKNKKDEYALDYAARAYLLADDKKAFRNEKWIDELVKETIDLARQYEGKEQWLKALRLYSDLSSVDPADSGTGIKRSRIDRRVRKGDDAADHSARHQAGPG
jgi:hypothetical protein